LHDRHNSFAAVLIGIAGWLVPGAGHLLLRMWTRGLGVFAMVAALAWTGIALRGRMFTFTTDDFFDLLGFFADCGAGSFFYFAMKYNNGGPDVAHAAGDYGTRFFAAAGVLNVLAAVDAYRLARGDEQDDEDESQQSEMSPASGAESAAGPASTQDGADPASQPQLDPAATAATALAGDSTPETSSSASPSNATTGSPLPRAQEPSRE
jgi:hypothetical protein